MKCASMKRLALPELSLDLLTDFVVGVQCADCKFLILSVPCTRHVLQVTHDGRIRVLSMPEHVMATEKLR